MRAVVVEFVRRIDHDFAFKRQPDLDECARHFRPNQPKFVDGAARVRSLPPQLQVALGLGGLVLDRARRFEHITRVPLDSNVVAPVL